MEQMELGLESPEIAMPMDMDIQMAEEVSICPYISIRVRMTGDTAKEAVRNLMEHLKEVGVDPFKCYDIVVEEHLSKGTWVASTRASVELEEYLND